MPRLDNLIEPIILLSIILFLMCYRTIQYMAKVFMTGYEVSLTQKQDF